MDYRLEMVGILVCPSFRGSASGPSRVTIFRITKNLKEEPHKLRNKTG
jgi:hypothetical protein